MDDEQNYTEDSQQRNEHEGEYFVNRNIFKDGVTTDDREFSRTGKALCLFIPLMIAIIIVMVIIALFQSFLAGIPATIACGIAYIWFIRKTVFDENQFKRLIANNELQKEMMISDFNNVLNIADDDQMFFQTSKKGLASAFFVTFNYASLIDETDKANENVIRIALVPFLQQLHDNHLDVEIYDIAVNSTLSIGTLELIKRAKNVLTEDSWLQLVETLQNETAASLEQNGSAQYRIFFKIINSDYRNVTNFKGILLDIINSTLMTSQALTNPHIMDQNEIINFLLNYYKTQTFPLEDRNTRKISVAKYFKFVSFFDINGQEYNIDAFNPEFNTSGTATQFDVDRSARMAYGNKKSKTKRQKSNEQHIEETRKRQQQQIDNAQARKAFQHNGIVKPGAITDKSYQRKQKEQQLEERKQQALQNQLKKTREAQQHSQRGNGDISLNDLLNQFK